MYKTTIPRFFEAAHQLPDSDNLLTKACARLHGHTYHVVVNFESEDNTRNGMVVDFKGVKNIIDKLDHQYINDVFELEDFRFPPTAENIAKFFWSRITLEYPDLQELQVLVAEGYKGKEHSAYVSYR